jgi:hypothetical protein
VEDNPALTGVGVVHDELVLFLRADSSRS